MLIFNIVVSSQGLPGAQGDLPPVQSLYPDTRVAWIRVVGTTWTTGSEPSRFRGPRLSLCVKDHGSQGPVSFFFLTAT